MRSIIGMTVAAALAAVVLGGCKERTASNANEILIGEYGSLSGGTATFGTSTHKGLLLAVDQINNGINQAKAGLAQVAQQAPVMRPINDFMQAMKCEADGKSATLTSTLKGDATMLIAIPMMGIVAEQPQVAPPAAVGAQAVQPPPPPPPVERK